MSQIAVVLGTRPEIVKLSQIIRLLGDDLSLIHTGQHYNTDMSDTFFDLFELLVIDYCNVEIFDHIMIHFQSG